MADSLAAARRQSRTVLETAPGAPGKELLVRDEDVQVLHGFRTVVDARAYLAGQLFTRDVSAAACPRC
ncbi:hypothetical protein RKD26_000061 [Streptomyces calvus]|uniref:hypothetical protein n=1 Tax=Streptomyces calvus TaxID=67282 RepID=UPI00351740B0